MIGLKRGTVALFDHESEWETEAARTIERLKAILGGDAEEIRHVGSTAIRSIKAKPIIDIAVAVADFDDILKHEDELRAAGFYYRPGARASLRDQLLFARGSFYDGSGDLQTHFIHVVLTGSGAWNDYVNFVEYMNSHPDAAGEYGALKLSLAEKAPVDRGRELYTAGKHEFITRILKEAESD